ncbi:MAG: porin family protein [Proteobacteria bacterium]|nr:porin family protein [Pseudomonadota bacterium]
MIATAKIFLPLLPIEPYAEFGIGSYFTKLDVEGNLGNFSGSSEVTYGLHAGAGVNLNITENVFLGIEGRYLWAKPSYGGQDIKLDGFTTTADLGFRF